MKITEMKNKTIILVEFERVYPELDEETEKRYKKEGITSYYLDTDKIAKAVTAKVYYTEEKKDPLDEVKIRKLYYETSEGVKGVIRINHKSSLIELFPGLYIERNLAYLKEQIHDFLKL